jgi:hypothetical protein
MDDIIEVLRLIRYRGPRIIVEQQVLASIHGRLKLANGMTIDVITIDPFPRVLNLHDIAQELSDDNLL